MNLPLGLYVRPAKASHRRTVRLSRFRGFRALGYSRKTAYRLSASPTL